MDINDRLEEITMQVIQEKNDIIKELERDLKLNASMLAKQTDLAREAETNSMRLERELNEAEKERLRLQGELANSWQQIDVLLGIKDGTKPA